MMASPNNSPSARYCPFTASAGNLVYLWGGQGDTEPEAVFLFHRDTETWVRQHTRGLHPPAGLYSGGCCISGQHLYFYGGWDGKTYHGVLYELNTNSWTWRKLSDGGTGGPGKKRGCRMILYQNQLLVVGGKYDEMPSTKQAGSSYKDGLTNEVHCFNLITNLWSSSSMKGSRPPCEAFSLTVTDEDQAVMFGGITSSDWSSEAYVLHLPTMTWSRHKKGDPWPDGRFGHIAACLGYGGQNKTVLIGGGYNGVTLDDMWLLDPQSGRMEEMQVPEKYKELLQRSGRATATLTVNSDCVEVILFGGYNKNISIMADTTILRFMRQASAPEGASPAQRWILVDPDKFVLKRKQKLEVSDANASESLKESKIQASRGDPEIARHDVDQGREMLENSQDIVSTTSSEKTSDLDDVISQTSERNPTSLGTQDFADHVTKAVDQNQQIERKMANIILKGLPEAGKSTLLNRLLNKPFQQISSSTGLSDGIVVVDIKPTSTLTSAATASDNSSWEVTDFDTSVYFELEQLEDLKDFLPSTEEEFVGNDTSDSPSYQVGISSTAEISENIKKVLSAHSVKSIKGLRLKNSLYIRDTGGQVEFQESLTLLLHGPSIFVFVLRVDIDIHKKTTIRYRSPSGETINEYKSSISTVDALVQFLTSVSAIDTTEEGVFQQGGVYKSHEPVVFIVGTHMDLLESRAGSVIAEMNKSLDKSIRKHGFSNVRYADNTSSRVMYTVDNTSVKDDNFKILRSDINGYIIGKQEFVVLYPVSFLLFCLELQNIKTAVISIAKFRQLASKFSITSEQIHRLLHFLHFRIGIIQYYDIDNLSDIVIKEPQVLFNKVTELLVKTFLLPKALKMDQQRSFQQKGILDAAVLESILGESENEITAKQFLAYMVHLRLAVPFKDKSGIMKYFFPCVLNHVQASDGEERKTDIAPLAICFMLGHCPQGLFGVLISHLVSPVKSHKFSFEMSENKIYQDQVVLLIKSSGVRDEISLKRHLSHIEVTMSSPVKESKPLSLPRSATICTVCTTVRSILKHCLQLSMKTLRYDDKKLQPMFCLSCPNDCATKHHEIEYDEIQACYTMYCKIMPCEIPPSGQYWFDHQDHPANASATEKTQCAQSSANEKSSSSTAPAVNACQEEMQSVRSSAEDNSSASTGPTLTPARDLTMQQLTLLKWTDRDGQRHSLRLKDSISSKWREVGDLLRVDSSRQDSIHMDCGRDVKLCCRAVLLDWLKMEEPSYPTNWEGLADLLEDLEFHSVAKKLKEALNCIRKHCK